MTTRAQTVRTFGGDAGGRIRNLQAAGLFPTNPMGRPENLTDKRGLASLIISWATSTAIYAARVVEQYERMHPYAHSGGKDPVAAFMYVGGAVDLRGHIEGWLDHLAALSPTELNAVEHHMLVEKRWVIRMFSQHPGVDVEWGSANQSYVLEFRPSAPLPSSSDPVPRGLRYVAFISFDLIATAARLWRATLETEQERLAAASPARQRRRKTEKSEPFPEIL
jgi:hypothetical protein